MWWADNTVTRGVSENGPVFLVEAKLVPGAGTALQPGEKNGEGPTAFNGRYNARGMEEYHHQCRNSYRRVCASDRSGKSSVDTQPLQAQLDFRIWLWDSARPDEA